MKVFYAFLSLIFLLGCSSGKKAFERGDYDAAVSKAVNRLRSDIDNRNASNTLPRAYDYAVEMHQRNITNAKSSLDPYKWERVVREYQTLNYLYDEIQRCPACRDYVYNAQSFEVELNDAKEKAAAGRYNLAVEAMKSKTSRLKAIEAHQHLLKVQNYFPGYKNTEDLLNEALYYATLKVVVEPIPAPSRILKLNQEFFTNKVNEYLRQTAISPYVRFYTPEEAESGLEWVDHVIHMEFDQFSLGNLISHTEVREVSRDSVVLKEEEDGKKIYGTVKAEFTTNEKSIVGSGLLDFQIRDSETGSVITQEKFPSEYKWTIRWASYQGDERALTEEQKILLKNKELSIPVPQFMFEEFAAPLYDQVIHKLTDYYRHI